MKIIKRLGFKIYCWINDGGWISCLVMGFLGLLCAVVSLYGTLGFNWVRFLFADLPLFSFCGWALYNGIFKRIKNDNSILYGGDRD